MASLLLATLAHPDLIDRKLCGAAAHPDRPLGAHGPPISDGSVRLGLKRLTGQIVWGWSPGEEFHLFLDCGADRRCQGLVTSDGGVWQSKDWKTEVHCAGRRINSIASMATHELLWRAPSEGLFPISFNATVAISASNAFLRAETRVPCAPEWSQPLQAGSPLVSMNASEVVLLSDLYDSPPKQLMRPAEFDTYVTMHGWLGALAFALLFPLTAICARFADKGKHVAAATGEPCFRWLGPSGWLGGWLGPWLQLHIRLGYAGASCACGAFALIELHKISTTSSHFRSWHAIWGGAAYSLVPLQLFLGYLRPAPVPRSWARSIWRVAHAATGCSIVLAGVISTALGLRKAVAHRIQYANALRLFFLVHVTIAAIGVATLEVRRWYRRRRGNGPEGKDGAAAQLLSPELNLLECGQAEDAPDTPDGCKTA